MSNMYNEMLLENYFEEGLAMGMTEEEAEKYAYDMLENNYGYC